MHLLSPLKYSRPCAKQFLHISLSMVGSIVSILQIQKLSFGERVNNLSKVMWVVANEVGTEFLKPKCEKSETSAKHL